MRRAAVQEAGARWLLPGPAGDAMGPKGVREAFRACLKTADITRQVRLHDLRHTYASLAIQRGVSS